MKKAVMYGAGNIGRGFIGQLFSQSGYEVVFLDVNQTIIDRLNSDRRYPVRIVTNDGYEEQFVENVRAVNATGVDSAAEEIAAADIMATAVGVNVLPHIAKTIAAGLKKRWERGNLQPLNIIICENLLDANHFLEKLIKQELHAGEIKLFDETVGLVEASIGRMVPLMTPEMLQDNPLRVCVEEYCELPVDKDAFKGAIPGIINMKPYSPFGFYIQRKLFMHNMGHATMAYMSFLAGRQYIWEGCRDAGIKLIILRALLESSAAMSGEHGVPLKILIDHAEDLLFRFGNKLLGDTVERVGRDPVRKLSKNDRLIGAGLLCLDQGIKPVYIALGIAAGFLFNPPDDPFAARVQETVAEKGIEQAVTEFCGIDSSSPLFGMIIEFYRLLAGKPAMGEILEKAEKMKAQGY